MTFVRYIAFEGIDGAGKTTQISLLINRLREYNITAIPLAEPTHGKFGSMIRANMIKGGDWSIERQRELFTEDRRDHVERKIKPLLKFVSENDAFVIVQDRSYLSAPAYQADREDQMLAVLREQQSFAPKPDVFLLLDLPAEAALGRIRGLGRKRAIFEDPETLENARERYRYLADNSGENVRVVDASQSEDKVSRDIQEILELNTLDARSEERR